MNRVVPVQTINGRYLECGYRLAYPANSQIHTMMQRVILAEYEKMVGTSEAVSNARTAAERLRVLEQLKSDGLITKAEYNTKRKEILREL